MARTYGYGIQAFVGGLKGGLNIGTQMLELKREKKAREDLKKAEEKIKEVYSKFITDNREKIDDFENLSMSERYSINMAMYNFSKEHGDLYRQASEALDKKDFAAFEQINELINTKIDKDLEVGIKYGETINPKYFEDPMGTKPFTPEELERFKTGAFYKESPAKVQESIAPSVAGEMGLDLKFQPEKPKTAIISDYKGAWDYLYRHRNAQPETFNKVKIGFQKQFPNIDMTAITQESLREPGKMTEPKITTPAPTSTENIREDILNADTFADANRIYKNYSDKYDSPALGITDLKQEWARGQVDYLNKVKKSIENLLVDRGDKGKWLSNKLVTQETVGLEFKGERPASEIYEMLYKSYIEYLEKLRKLGIDVSQFPELLPLSEIEKVGGTEGFFGLGIQKGDYKSIYK